MTPTVHRLSASSVGGGVAVIAVYVLQMVYSITIPGEVVAGGTALLTALVSALWSAVGPDRVQLDE